MDALIVLKQSRKPQFSHPPGARALAEPAAKQGNDAAPRRLQQCRSK
jgi:hypothetical protein